MKKNHSAVTLFWTFLKIGLFTFGGGYAMIPLIQAEITEKKHWMRSEEILDILVIAESTPGPISVNAATYVGYKVGGLWGAIVATFGLVLPSFVIIFSISYFLDAFMALRIVQAAFNGIELAVALLVLNAGLKLKKDLPNDAFSITLLAATFVLLIAIDVLALHISTLYLILGGAVLGLVFGFLQKKPKETSR